MEAAAAPFASFVRRLPNLPPCGGVRLLAVSVPFFCGISAWRGGSRELRRSIAASANKPSDRIVALPSSELRKQSSSGSGDASGDEKLRALRDLFSRPDVGIDAYIIPSQDAHQSEFIAECFMRRAYITGFTGSAGTAVVTKDKAALWTDGRYFLQAEKQLNKEWILMRSGNLGVPTTTEWLNEILTPGCRIGIDPFLFSSDAAEELKEAISRKEHELVFLYNFNLVDEVWKESRPKPPMEPTRIHDIRYAGVDISTKLSSLRSELTKAGATSIIISMLDEVAWLLNMRGNDVPHSPVFYAYLVVEISSAKLFIDGRKVTKEVAEHLNSGGVQVRPYEEILAEIKRLAKQGAKLWLDPSSVNAAIVNIFKSFCVEHYTEHEGKEHKKASNGPSINQSSKRAEFQTDEPIGVYKFSPIAMAKAVKNEAEMEGMRNSHIRDAAALAEFWAWMDEVIKQNEVITEVDVADKLLKFRKKQSGFLDTSFSTISGYGANGAIIHYNPNPESCAIVDDKNLFLLDSGGQYIDGTTDVTRTVHFGEPSSRQKECFTRVLQGHIAIDKAIFPEGTPGFVLDVLARSPLWKIGLDYRHGTGHGVGAALNVHEGPQSISFRYGNMTALLKGMVVSNEPGYYEDNMFGIRIENLLHVKEVDLPNSFGGIGYLGFEKLTFVPIQTKLVDQSLLSLAEIKWLNDYHLEVWEKVSPFLDGSARKWLWINTRPLPSS